MNWLLEAIYRSVLDGHDVTVVNATGIGLARNLNAFVSYLQRLGTAFTQNSRRVTVMLGTQELGTVYFINAAPSGCCSGHTPLMVVDEVDSITIEALRELMFIPAPDGKGATPSVIFTGIPPIGNPNE